MSKRAEELAKQLYPDPKLENYDDILVYRTDRDNALMGRANVICVYEQAEKDFLEKAVKWLLTQKNIGRVFITNFRKAMEEDE